MALIKCPECGNEISDKASACPSCGYPINKSNLDQSEQQNSKTITNTENNTKKTKRNIILAVVLGILILVVIMVITVRLDSGLYNGLEYGITYEELQNKCDNSLLKLDSNVCVGEIEDFYGIKGVKGIEYYEFDGAGKLGGIVIMLSSDDYSGKELEAIVIDAFSKKYGKPSDTSNGGKWETKKSTITASYASYSGFVNVKFDEKEEQ